MNATASIILKEGIITAIHPMDSGPYQVGDTFTIVKTKKALFIGFNPILLQHIPVGMWLECHNKWWYLVWME